MVEPSAKWTIFFSASTLVTSPCLPKRFFSLGRVSATAIQIPPVPSRAGNRKVALGPQLPATLFRMTFLVTVLISGAATRSPSHWHCIYDGVSIAEDAATVEWRGWPNVPWWWGRPRPCSCRGA